MRSASIAVVAAVALSGCATLPSMQTPTIETSANFRHMAGWTTATPADHLDRGEWWRDFSDPVLDDLMALLDERTPTLAAALARYDRALAAARLDRSNQLLNVDLSGKAARERISAGRSIGSSEPVTTNQIIFGVGLDYELDLWSRVRNSVRAATADVGAQEAALRSARLSLQASVADLYVQLRAVDAEQVLLTKTAVAYARADVWSITPSAERMCRSTLFQKRLRIFSPREALQHPIDTTYLT